MTGRLENAIVGGIIGLLALAVAGLAALLAKLIFKKSIGTPKYYATVGGVLWVLMNAALFSVLPKAGTTDAGRTTSEPISANGLDAPFIAPPRDKMETFIGELDTAVTRLSPADKASFMEAMGFLTFAAAEYIKETEPARFVKWDQQDIAAHSLLKMYNFARDNGDKMTLRKYIALADEMKKQKPDWLQQYTAEHGKP